MRLFKRGGGDLGRVDLREPDAGSPDASRSVAQRNGVFARWVSDASGLPLKDAVDDLPRLFGLSLGRSRLTDALLDRRTHEDPSLSERLADLFESELQAASDAISGAVPAESLELVAAQYGPIPVISAARVYLLGRRLKTFAGRTLGEAIETARTGQLGRLSPVAPIGPLRLQAERAIKDLRDPALASRLLPELEIPRVSGSEAGEALREQMVRALIDEGFVPRLVGTFRRPQQPVFVVVYEHPARSKRDLAELGLQVLAELQILLAHIETDPLDVDERPLAIDFWLLRNRKLARNIGWRQLGDHNANVQLTKGTMISFVDGPDANLPFDAVGYPYEPDLENVLAGGPGSFVASDAVTSGAFDADLDDAAGGPSVFEIFQHGSREAWGKVAAVVIALISDPQRSKSYLLAASIVKGLYERERTDYQVRALRGWAHEASEGGVEMALELAAKQLGPGQDALLNTLPDLLRDIVRVGVMAIVVHSELEEMDPRLFHTVLEPIGPLVAEWGSRRPPRD